MPNDLSGQINVKMFGAKGNGITDDTSAIQSAINATINSGKKELFFPPGTYKTTSALSNANIVSFIGDGVTFTSNSYSATSTYNKLNKLDSKWINIKNYAYLVNQTTGSWSPAITQALSDATANGQNLYFPSGTYPINQTINMPAHVSIAGAGMKSTIIKLITGSACNIINFAKETYSDHSLTDLCVQGDIDINGSGVATTYTGTTQYIGIEIGKTYTDAGMIEGQTLEVNGCYINNVLVQRCYGHGIQVNKRVWVVRLMNLEIRQNYGAGIMNYGTDNFFTNFSIYQNGYGLRCYTSGHNKYDLIKAYQNGVNPSVSLTTVFADASSRGNINLDHATSETLNNIEAQEAYTVNYRIISCNNVTATNLLSDCAGRENVVNSTTYAVYSYNLFMSGCNNVNIDMQCTDETNISTFFPYNLDNCKDCRVNIIGDLSKFPMAPRIIDTKTFVENVFTNQDHYIASLRQMGVVIPNKFPKPDFSDLSSYVFTGCNGAVSNGELLINFTASGGNVVVPLGSLSSTLESYLLFQLNGTGAACTYNVTVQNSAGTTIPVPTIGGSVTNSALAYLKKFTNSTNETLYFKLQGTVGASIKLSYIGVIDSTFYGSNIGMSKAYNMMMRSGLKTTNIVG